MENLSNISNITSNKSKSIIVDNASHKPKNFYILQNVKLYADSFKLKVILIQDNISIYDECYNTCLELKCAAFQIYKRICYFYDDNAILEMEYDLDATSYIGNLFN